MAVEWRLCHAGQTPEHSQERLGLETALDQSHSARTWLPQRTFTMLYVQAIPLGTELSRHNPQVLVSPQINNLHQVL